MDAKRAYDLVPTGPSTPSSISLSTPVCPSSTSGRRVRRHRGLDAWRTRAEDLRQSALGQAPTRAHAPDRRTRARHPARSGARARRRQRGGVPLLPGRRRPRGSRAGLRRDVPGRGRSGDGHLSLGAEQPHERDHEAAHRRRDHLHAADPHLGYLRNERDQGDVAAGLAALVVRGGRRLDGRHRGGMALYFRRKNWW